MPAVLKDSSSRGKVIFFHIPKTGGMSLRGLLVKNYRGYKQFNTDLFGVGPEAWKECLERARQIPEDDWDDYCVLKGHMRFGLHEVLPEPVPYITFLREPLARAISFYRMHYRNDEKLARHPIDPARPGWNLEAFPSFARSLDNGQTRLLGAVDPDLPFGACTVEHLNQAKANIEKHFRFVGLTEKFDLSLMLLGKLCGWQWHFYVPDNVAPADPLPINDDLRSALRDLNRWDEELYRFAADRFQALVDHYGFPLRLEHRLFQFGNAVHQRLHVARQRLKKGGAERQRPAMRRTPAETPRVP